MLTSLPASRNAERQHDAHPQPERVARPQIRRQRFEGAQLVLRAALLAAAGRARTSGRPRGLIRAGLIHGASPAARARQPLPARAPRVSFSTTSKGEADQRRSPKETRRRGRTRQRTAPADSRAEDARQAADRLRRRPCTSPCSSAPGAARDQAVERGLHQPPCRAPDPLTREAEQRQVARERQDQKPGADQREAAKQQALLAEAAGQAARSARPAGPPTARRHRRRHSRPGAGPSRIARSPTARRCSPSRQRPG